MDNMVWNYLKANGTCIYPSQNASDKGAVNAEQNVAGIADSLAYKAFVVRKNENETPLQVVKTGDSLISVTPGRAILEGYQLDLYDIVPVEGGSSDYIIYNYEVSKNTIKNLGTFLTKFKAAYLTLYDEQGNRKDVSKKVLEETKLPLLHVIVKLLKNATGNVRGDLIEMNMSVDPPTRTITCKGLTWALATDDDLATMTVPYLDLATILVNYVKTPSDDSVVTIKEVINNNSKYTYIDQSSIITEGDQTTEEYVQNYVTEALDDLDHISSHSIEQPDGTHVTEETDARIKRVRFQVNNAVGAAVGGHPSLPYQYDPKAVAVIRYKYEYNDGYDADGNREVTEYPMDTAYNYSYSIDDIQQRTHISSTTVTSDYIENAVWHHDTIAHTVDSRDQGDGSYQVQVSPSVVNGNGSSKLISRADHDHNGMYIKNYNYGGSGAQTTGSLNVTGNLSTTGTFSSGNITVNGTINAIGDITGNRVWNAVWNDYAELFLKDSSKKNYTPGTVICKVRGRDCYTESNADNRELVVGVCSDSYGMLLGGKKENTLEQNLKEYIPVAVSGRVWANIRKGIYVREGDMLVVSRIDKGCVVPCDKNDLEFGTIVGKALSSNKDGKVLVLVSIM